MRSALVFPLALAVFSIITPALAAEPTDVMNAGYSPALAYAQEIKMLTPLSDGLLHPEMPLGRMDLASGIAHAVYADDIDDRCFDKIAPSVPAHFTWLFTDVPTTSVHAKEVCVGMLVGILEGHPNGSLGGNEGANLVETAKMLTKAYGIAPLPSLRLQSHIPWHEPYWFALAKRNAIPASVTDRNATLTRGEFAEIVYRLQTEKPLYGFRETIVHPKIDMLAPAVTPEANIATVTQTFSGANGAPAFSATFTFKVIPAVNQAELMRQRIKARHDARWTKWESLRSSGISTTSASVQAR